jgi:hypothetical protein
MIKQIKEKIKKEMDELKNSGILKIVELQNYNVDLISQNFSSYPVGILTPPSMSSEVLDNRDNLRTYTMALVVLFNSKNHTNTNFIDETIEQIIDHFDNKITLDGILNGWIEPSSSSPYKVKETKDLILVDIFLKIKIVKPLGF